MLEKKFKDVTGFSDKNTFYQLDQFETQKIRGAKNRFIYDFSFPVIPGKADDYFVNDLNVPEGTSARPHVEKILTNLAPSVAFGAHGTPGGKADLVSTNVEQITFTGGNTGWDGEFLTQKTINENEASLAVNKDTFMFLNGAISDAFGSLQRAEFVDYFRAGYIEFTIKTDNQNCIVASGSTEIDASDLIVPGLGIFAPTFDQGASISSLSKGDTVAPNNAISVDYPYYQAPSFDGALVNLNIRIKDGKLAVEYYDEYNRDNVDFTFIGNDIVADNEWHHVVINFGRPGLIKKNGNKFNKKFVEIWLDGNLDKRFDDIVNEYQIFYPVVKWLFNNPKEIVDATLNSIDLENSPDIRGTTAGSSISTNRTVGFNELLSDRSIFELAVKSESFANNAFSGAIHTYAHGVNIPISQYEIKRRLRLWQKQTKKFASAVNVFAEMPTPSISTNSKKALRLFWNNLVDNGSFGVELDDSFDVYSYSVTHQTLGSKTETFNVDSTVVKKDLNVLENVRAAFTDNMTVNGPGMVFFANTQEAYIDVHSKGPSASAVQTHPKSNTLDSVSNTDLSGFNRFVGPRSDLTFSGLVLNSGERILLTGQIKPEENGIWIFNGLDSYLTRSLDSLISDDSKINVVYVTEGYNSGMYFRLNEAIESLNDSQYWSYVNVSDIENIQSDPIYSQRWKNYRGEDRFINILEDINIDDYDLITFMNYPTSNDEIFANFPNENKYNVLEGYKEFINYLKIAASNGANLFVSSPKLAEDMGIVKKYQKLSQEIEDGDARSAAINPFQINEPANKYFDTHRQNKYHLNIEVPGLTDKETWVITDAINYVPENVYDYEQLHLKYAYRQFGLQAGNEFVIPSLPLMSNALNKDLPGYRSNARFENIYAVAPQDILSGTALTSLANTHYHQDQLVNNEYDDYATTIIVHYGQLLGDYPIYGKIFVNCVEDSYTMSREEYNKGIVQSVSINDAGESLDTVQWNYSTNRVNRVAQRVDVKQLTGYGQTTPTLGNGGPVVQSATNSANGIIKHETHAADPNYRSDLYTTISEEIYPIQEIPVLSMTWLGLQWLAE